MEVEVMKANNRPLAEAGANWPMDCICNLCSCGSHSCASFALNGDAAAANNRCLAAGHSVNKLRGDQRKDSQRDEQCAGCQFDSGERYLATAASSGKGTPAGQRSPTKRGAGKATPKETAIDPELVHVMITRPEIASKPRDNILFEGDMDLRTTFETSYEALAKMRLEQWKNYQEAMKSATPIGDSNRRLSTTATKSRRQVSPIVGDYAGDGDDAPHGSEGGEKDTEQGKRKGVSKLTGIQAEPSRRQQKMMEPGDSSAAIDTMAATTTTTTTTPPRSRTPFAVAHTNSQQNIIHDDETDWDYHYNLNQSSRSRQVSPSLNAAAAAQQYYQPAVERPGSSQKQQLQQLESEAKPEVADGRQHQQSAGYVDPDLASIIVYDANMNRLERVGIRKRSKYRPSTSLRSGARGLFGDQEPEKEQQSDDRSGGTSRGEDKAMQTDNGDKTVVRTPAPAPMASSRGSAAMRARNLKNSSQTPDRLVYSERNLPVNTKRRVDDNVNMRDHLREQNIVDRGRYESTAVARNNQRPDEDEQVNENGFVAAEEGLALEREMADIRLAEQEEAAANAEIQRVAAQDPAAVAARSSAALMHQHNQSSLNSAAGGGMDTRTSSRQSRLQRTCQEQSFHIGQNNYPVGPAAVEKFSPNPDAKVKTSAMSSTHASPQSRVYNNLFSESPDFILTTGKSSSMMAAASAADDRTTQRETSREDKKQRYTNVTGHDDGGGGGGGGSDRLIDSRSDYQAAPATGMRSFADQYQCVLHHQAHDDGYTRDGECRVARLGERFQYVGSRSGHKYFVEKILEPE